MASNEGKAPGAVSQFACADCQYKTEKKFNLDRPVKRRHTAERPFKCPYPQCPASFTESSSLKRHQVVHTKEIKFECPTCHKKFGQKYDLTKHQRTHGSERPFACTLCPYTAIQKCNLEGHLISVHSDAKPIKCGQCGYRGKTKEVLNRHLKVHLDSAQKEKVKTHPCPHCPYKTMRVDDLKTHLRTPSGQRPFVCPHCEYKTSLSGSLKAHIARVHTAEKKFECKFCDYTTVTSSQLNGHMRCHTGEKPYKCPFEGCQYAAARSSDLGMHERAIHGGLRPFKCSQCPYAATYKNNLRRHQLTQHGA